MFHLLLDVAFHLLLTLVGQFLVQCESSVRRSIGRNFDVLEIQALAVLADLLQQGNELLYGTILQLALTQLCLLNQELDVGLLLLSNHTLETILGYTALRLQQCFVPQFASGNYTISYLDGRDLDGLLANLGVKRKVELALLHGFLIGEHALHRVVSAQQVRDGLVVTQYLFTLE